MITLLTLNITGFCSIANNFKLNLNQNCTILIKASNGSGKSTIFSALVWVLYGKNTKGVSEVNTWKSSQPKDYSGTMVELYFKRDNSVYKVVRCQKYTKELEDGAKGKDRLLLYKDGELLNIKGKVNIQDKVNQALGLSYNLFMNSIMFGQGLKRLIQETNADKKKLFEEIFDLNFINKAKELAVDKKSEITSEKNNIIRDKNYLMSELESAKETYHELKAKEKNFNKNIEEERKEFEYDRKRLTEKLRGIKKEFSEEKEILLNSRKTKYENTLSKLKADYKSARSISNTPLYEFIDEIFNLMKLKKYTKVMKLLKQLKKAFKDSSELEEQIQECNTKISNCTKALREIETYKNKANDICDDIHYIDKQLAKLNNKKASEEVTSPKYKKRARLLKAKIDKLELMIKDLDYSLDNYSWVINDPLGNNGIKAYLFDSSLFMLNEALEKYSDILGFHIEFSIDLESTRKDFVTLIERDNHIIDYDELSGGEKQLCNIAMAFAMNETLTSSKGINIAFLDEVFESLSQDNIEIVISLVKQVFQGKTLFLITHHESLPFSNSKTLQVEKIKGISNYKVL